MSAKKLFRSLDVLPSSANVPYNINKKSKLWYPFYVYVTTNSRILFVVS